MDKEFDPWCLTLPEEYWDERDFKAEEAIELDLDQILPESFSLGYWIYKTSNQWSLGSCTSLGTTHGVQILNVRKSWKVPTYSNIITPSWKDLWAKMWHSVVKYDWWDYVEKAVNTALKEWIYIEESGELAKFDGYATDEWHKNDECIETMKRYLYQKDPIVWCIRWDKQMRKEMRLGRVTTVPKVTTQWHCILLVWWDKWWMWFINSWDPNDEEKRKCRFFIDYNTMKQLAFNPRYWVLYIEEDQNLSPEYLKRKNNYVLIMKVLRKIYPEENSRMKKTIEQFSNACRKFYREIDEEFPLE